MAKNKLPKWAIKKAGGINKEAWRLYRAGKGGSNKPAKAKGTKSKGGSGTKKGGKPTRKRRSTSRPFTFFDNMVAIAHMISPLIVANKIHAANGNGAQYLVGAYTGAGFDENWNYINFDHRRMVSGAGITGEAILYKKQMALINKAAPVKSLIPKTIGDVRNIITNVIARIGVIVSVDEASKFPPGHKMVRFSQNMSVNYTGIKLGTFLEYNGFDGKRAATGQAPFAGAFVFQKSSAEVTKYIKGGFKLPRFS